MMKSVYLSPHMKVLLSGELLDSGDLGGDHLVLAMVEGLAVADCNSSRHAAAEFLANCTPTLKALHALRSRVQVGGVFYCGGDRLLIDSCRFRCRAVM